MNLLDFGTHFPTPSREEKGRNCATFKVPLFLREGFRVSYFANNLDIAF
jgi:hypothetical protein